jgi:hypothetical protein
MKKLLLASLCLISFSTFAQDKVIIKTRAGKTVEGRVLQETSRGYLVAAPSGTQLIEYTNVVDFQKVEAAAVAPAVAPTPVPLPVAEPSAPPVVSTPVYAPVAAPAPMPVENIDESNTENPESSREGLHIGLGGGAFANPAVTIGIEAHFDWTFGKVGFRVSPQVQIHSNYSGGFILFSAHPQFHFNVVKIYSLGAGIQTGLAVGTRSILFLGPTISPAIFKLGERGQHQIEARFSIPIIQFGSSGYGSLFPVMGMLTYSYLF